MPFESIPPKTGVSSTSATVTPKRPLPMAAPTPPELPPTMTTSNDSEGSGCAAAEAATSITSNEKTWIRRTFISADSGRTPNARVRFWLRNLHGALAIYKPLREAVLSSGISKFEVAPLRKIGQPAIVQPEQGEERCVNIMQVDPVFHCLKSEFIGLSDDLAAFHAASRQPASRENAAR